MSLAEGQAQQRAFQMENAVILVMLSVQVHVAALYRMNGGVTEWWCGS